LYKITTADRMLRNLVNEYEKLADPRLPACSRKSGKLLETCCTIMDLKGVGITKAPSVYGYLRSASAISQDHYPERLGKLYLINAPWGFSTVFSVVKSFLDPVTVQKIHVLGSGYQAELLSQVPMENLPKQFGGTCECDGGCELGDQGPWQEEEWAKPPKWALTKEEPAAAADEVTKKMDEVKIQDEAKTQDEAKIQEEVAELEKNDEKSEVELSGEEKVPA
jgi:CRAL/TRIO domain